MKKCIQLSFLSVVLIAGLLSVPVVLGKIVAPVQVAYPAQVRFSEDINVSGAVEETAKKEITVELPIVPEQVKVSIGDRVEVGDLIATVDVSATQAALFELVEVANVIPEEYIAALSGFRIDSQLAKGVIPTEITSPASGTVTGVSLIAGAMSTPSSTVCTISDLDSIRVKMSVGEEDADTVQKGDLVIFKATATGEEKYVGTVQEVFPTAVKTLVGTSQQTVVSLYVTMNQSYPRLKPGYTVEGAIKKKDGQTAYVIPYEAVLQDDENQEYVYVYQKARAIRKNITTGVEFTDGVAVLSGLGENDLVIQDASVVSGENCLVKISQ